LAYLQTLFPDEESFQRDFLVPLMVNSYNAGAARMAEAVQAYILDLESASLDALPKGKDLFIAMVDAAETATDGRLASYGQHAREYVTRVYAQAKVFWDIKKRVARAACHPFFLFLFFFNQFKVQLSFFFVGADEFDPHGVT
jgi:hypothetical protein